jgi:hypothetical protein
VLIRAAADYLAVRRPLRHKLARPEKLPAQFIAYPDQAGAVTVTAEHAVVSSGPGLARAIGRLRALQHDPDHELSCIIVRFALVRGLCASFCASAIDLGGIM